MKLKLKNMMYNIDKNFFVNFIKDNQFKKVKKNRMFIVYFLMDFLYVMDPDLISPVFKTLVSMSGCFHFQMSIYFLIN